MTALPRRAVLVAAAAGLVVAGGGVVAWQQLRADDGDRRAAEVFANAWVQGALDELRWEQGGADPAAQLAALTAGLTPAPEDLPAEVTVTSVQRDGDAATARLDVRWELGTTWRYSTSLSLRRTGGSWRPVLSPTIAHPDLAEGQVLRARAEQPPRAPITDRVGRPIVVDRPVVTVGIHPARTTDLAGTVSRIAALTGVDGTRLLARARAADADAFVEVITLRREAYDAQRAQLRPVAGTVFREGTRPLAPTTEFARALLGSVGPATAEVVEESQGRVRPDQAVGLSGLQERYDEQLGGKAGLQIEIVDAEGDVVTSLLSEPPVPGRPLQLTLDQTVQRAADAALAAAPAGRTAALVVVQPSTRDVLAVANGGPEGPGVDRALTGRYPPGSTFKIASTLALLRSGLTLDEVVPCPATTTVDGKVFKNAEDEVLGPQPFLVDFAHSCNTAFVGSASRTTSQQLQQAAQDLGYRSYDLGPEVFGGDVPLTDDEVEHAAQMIGQGKVLASPLSVAVSAAAVADGRLRPPRLLMETPAAEPGPVIAEAADLQQAMRQVVTDGTATVLRSVSGEPVSGKTGTAEFGTEVPPRTHAWFAGFSGDMAFAVLVDDGGFGGAVAAPLAGELLRALRCAELSRYWSASASASPPPSSTFTSTSGASVSTSTSSGASTSTLPPVESMSIQPSRNASATRTATSSSSPRISGSLDFRRSRVSTWSCVVGMVPPSSGELVSGQGCSVEPERNTGSADFRARYPDRP